MYAQEKKGLAFYFHFPDSLKKRGIRTAQQGTRKPGVYGIRGHIPENVISLFSGTGRNGNKMGIRKSPVKSRLSGLFICLFIPLFPFFIKRKGYARNRKKDAHVLCLCHKGIYAQCTIKIFYYTGGIEKNRKMEITCLLCL